MFTIDNSKKALQLFKEKIDQNKDYLSELDTPIGDGDHGNNMARGMEAVSESLQNKETASVQDVFKLTAMALISKVGGASWSAIRNCNDGNGKSCGNNIRCVADFRSWFSWY